VALYPFSKTWLLAAFLNLALSSMWCRCRTAASYRPTLSRSVPPWVLLARDLILGWGTWLWLRSVLVDRAPTEGGDGGGAVTPAL